MQGQKARASSTCSEQRGQVILVWRANSARTVVVSCTPQSEGNPTRASQAQETERGGVCGEVDLGGARTPQRKGKRADCKQISKPPEPSSRRSHSQIRDKSRIFYPSIRPSTAPTPKKLLSTPSRASETQTPKRSMGYISCPKASIASFRPCNIKATSPPSSFRGAGGGGVVQGISAKKQRKGRRA